ncbi:putative transcriptional regulator [Beijerinckia indica subsp. indica ATCC 9039]|uniref:Putative transcriptional regulator n=2 Tax=Beijerinckia TaxID=532 RepID=B2IHE1_BEII9|nr:putative transcriptional regulator [Beijerinckia indica subsp. indica ATCC 9039]
MRNALYCCDNPIDGATNMSLLDIFLDKVTEADLNNLISTCVPESPTIDYKRDTYGNSEGDKREFLADVSSFANTIGGDIVIGIDEAGGLPTAVKPLTGDIDAEVRRLESIALSGIEPRLTNLRIRSVPVAGGHAIIVRVPRSFVPPHRVIAQNSNRFYARAGTKKYEPNVEQLRHLFTDAPHVLERIRSFQADRLVKITVGETPTPLGPLGKVVLHVIPLPSFADGRMADIVSQLAKGGHVPCPLDEVGFSSNYAVNLDGYLSYSVGPPGARLAYAQFFRNGAIEGVGELRSDDNVNSCFITRDLTNLIMSRVRLYLDVLRAYDLGLPVYIFLSLCNATRVVYRYADASGVGCHDSRPLSREIVSVPEIYIDDFNVDVIDVMRPAFTTLWNAVGFLSCNRYDDLARWKSSNPYALTW